MITHEWDLWFPYAAATGMPFARGRLDPGHLGAHELGIAEERGAVIRSRVEKRDARPEGAGEFDCAADRLGGKVGAVDGDQQVPIHSISSGLELGSALLHARLRGAGQPSPQRGGH